MVIFPGAQWCHRHQMDHVSLKIAKKLSTRFEKQLKAPNILKGLHSKHLFCLLWFISKLLFSAFLLNILTLAVHKSAHVLLNQHLRQTDTQRNGHPEMLQLCQLWHNKFDAEKQQVAAPPRAPKLGCNNSALSLMVPTSSWSRRWGSCSALVQTRQAPGFCFAKCWRASLEVVQLLQSHSFTQPHRQTVQHLIYYLAREKLKDSCNAWMVITESNQMSICHGAA